MDVKAKDFFKYRISALDGEIGRVDDLYFDDSVWVVRYIVVHTGKLFGRKVLISPEAVNNVYPDEKRLELGLNREQIRNSPNIRTELPVSRHMEEELIRYYRWPVYWGGVGKSKEEQEQQAKDPGDTGGDPDLRSAKEVIGYVLTANDGKAGTVYDFIINDTNWEIRYIVGDIGKWIPGRKIIISPRWLDEVQWARKCVCAALDSESIENSPEYNHEAPVEGDYEQRLLDHYKKI